MYLIQFILKFGIFKLSVLFNEKRKVSKKSGEGVIDFIYVHCY